MELGSQSKPAQPENNDERKQTIENFKEFIKGLPRFCPPEFCESQTSQPSNDIPSMEDMEDFDWSIDQVALLEPVDFTYDHELNEELINAGDASLEQENEKYFQQSEILPSPSIKFTNPSSSPVNKLSPIYKSSPLVQASPLIKSSPIRSICSSYNSSPTVSSRRLCSMSLTPFNYCKAKQKRKLFSEHPSSRSRIQFSPISEKESNEMSLENVSSTSDLSKAVSFLSPIVAQDKEIE